MIYMWGLLCCSALFLVAVSGLGDSGRLFSLFVYHEKSLQSSGYKNWDALGCGVFTNSQKNAEFVSFFLDQENSVGELVLDIVPLYKNFDTGIGLYDNIVRNASNGNIKLRLLESNLIPGDSCHDNCPGTCSAAPKSTNDSCTPTYMDMFHFTAEKIIRRYPDVSFGVNYDIEQTDGGDYTEVFSALVSKRNAFVQSIEEKNLNFSGVDVVRPVVKGYNGFRKWISNVSTINHMQYFTPLRDSWDRPDGPILSTDPSAGSIKEEIAYCSSAESCKVQVGFETSAEDPDCKTYKRCQTSFVWGGGLANGTGLADWVLNDLAPFMLKNSLDIRGSGFASPPFFIEHHASFMAYQKNSKAGDLPATGCFREEEGCSTCCPNQKHKKMCSD
jgi:hypothetical protein